MFGCIHILFIISRIARINRLCSFEQICHEIAKFEIHYYHSLLSISTDNGFPIMLESYSSDEMRSKVISSYSSIMLKMTAFGIHLVWGDISETQTISVTHISSSSSMNNVKSVKYSAL